MKTHEKGKQSEWQSHGNAMGFHDIHRTVVTLPWAFMGFHELSRALVAVPWHYHGVSWHSHGISWPMTVPRGRSCPMALPLPCFDWTTVAFFSSTATSVDGNDDSPRRYHWTVVCVRGTAGLALGFQDLLRPAMVLPWAFMGLHGTPMGLSWIPMTLPRHCRGSGTPVALPWILITLPCTTMGLIYRHVTTIP